MEHNAKEPSVKWSPSLDRHRGNFWRSPMNYGQLMPPFLQRKPARPSFEQSHAEVPSKVTDIDSAPRTGLPVETRIASAEVTSDDCITACRNVESDIFDAETLNLRRSPTCEQDCRTYDIACGELRDRFDGETKSFGEITGLYDAHEHRGEDYQGREDDFAEDETDRRRPGRKTRLPPWWSDQCESFSSLSEAEEEPPGTTDPYLSHKLSIPYSRIPRPRYFKPVNEDAEYTAKALPRRPRSPVREILPGKFDLEAAYEEWKKQRQATETRKYLRESKDRISQSMKQLPTDQMDGDGLISTVVLQMILEQVTLTLIGGEIGGNVHTFVNIAMAWALYEQDIFNSNMLTTEESRLCDGLGLCNGNEVDDTDTMGDGGLRRILMGVYRPPFSHNVQRTLHRRLPWPYLSPSHERGHAKLYPNVRERITEKLPKVYDGDIGSTYVPDLKCFHLKEVLDKSYVAYKRKSLVRPPSPPDEVKEELLAQLLSFM